MNENFNSLENMDLDDEDFADSFFGNEQSVAEQLPPTPAPNQGYPAPAPNPGYQNPDPNQGYQQAPQNQGYQAPNQGYPAPNPGYQAPNPGYQNLAPNQGYQVPNQGYQQAPQGYQNPDPNQANANNGQQYVRKEKAKGVWAVTGQEIEFNRTWSGHRFTDEEVNILLSGGEVAIDGLVSKAGKTYGVIGKLVNRTYEGNEFVGFDRVRFMDRVPDSWCQYTFSDEEKTRLMNGETISIVGAISKKNKPFNCQLKYELKDDGQKALTAIFGS